MPDLSLWLRLSGASLIALALLHVFFPARFRWREELARISLLNRQIFYVHTLFVCLVLVQMGALCLFAPETMLERSRLGLWVAIGFLTFWLVRLFAQFFVYNAELWRGRRFETIMHGAFSLLWTWYVGIFGLVTWRQWVG